MAYFGLNSRVFVFVVSDCFLGKPVENVNVYHIKLYPTVTFVAFCIVSPVSYLHLSSSVNIVQEFWKLIKSYWFIFMIFLADIGRNVRRWYRNFTADFTMKLVFLWTTDKDRIILFGNLTEIRLHIDETIIKID